MFKTIFIVDDNDTNLTSAKEALKDQYRVMTLPSAAKMFALIEKVTPDLILLDIKMPEMDGFEALHLLKANASLANIPVIFLTSMADVSVEVRGFQLGVVDFITKPFSAPVLLNRLKTHLDIDSLIRERTTELRQRTEQLQHLQNSIVFVVADMVEKRDSETGGHIERTTAYMEILLDAMLEQGVYIEDICDIDFKLFVSSARLHDVGKITISDAILNKPGKLSDKESKIMMTHAVEGERIIDQIVSRAGDGAFLHRTRLLANSQNLTEEEIAIMMTHVTEGEKIIEQIITRTGDEVFLQNAKLFAGYHHEHWDGKGYPYGLKGTAIPIQGRLMAFADVYDALISERPYKKPITHEEAVEIIMENAGTQFDPSIANVFYSVSDQLKAVMLGCPKKTDNKR
ncbi:MAG: response regulator [Treponema sp.]|jgi:putative two-component system response regulator|nr:response regulator [Treponema sp.]